MNLWSEIESGSDIPDVVTAVIEVPKGSRNKYEYDKEREAFMLDRVLYSPVVYPADYGFIPKSTYDDLATLWIFLFLWNNLHSQDVLLKQDLLELWV